MVERRIRFSKEKLELVRKFLSSDEGTGPFKSQADVLAFAAALGAARSRREPLPDSLAEPIRQEVFDRQGYDTLINLLAVQSDLSASVLEDSDDMIAKRSQIFEEYANGGLSILHEETKGQVDFSQAILLMVSGTRKRDLDTPTFDLSKLHV